MKPGILEIYPTRRDVFGIALAAAGPAPLKAIAQQTEGATDMIGGLINSNMSSGDSVDAWAKIVRDM